MTFERPELGATLSKFGTVRLWRPELDDRAAAEAVARCLSAAFSSGLWRDAPMPLGAADDPTSARGVVASLGARPVAVAASAAGRADIIGCVVGCVMDDAVVDRYALDEYGAEPGDGLLAFIGIVPHAQGLRLRDDGGGRLSAAARSPSLARHLFQAWIDSLTIVDCPRLYIRTRRRIGPIRYLSADLGFRYRGGFEVEFRGQLQSRLVYCRTARRRGEP